VAVVVVPTTAAGCGYGGAAHGIGGKRMWSSFLAVCFDGRTQGPAPDPAARDRVGAAAADDATIGSPGRRRLTSDG
jgi:hypothetical protein